VFAVMVGKAPIAEMLPKRAVELPPLPPFPPRPPFAFALALPAVVPPETARRSSFDSSNMSDIFQISVNFSPYPFGGACQKESELLNRRRCHRWQ